MSHPLSAPVPTNRRSLGRPDNACNVIGVMKRLAAGVITTSTAMSDLTSRRVSSAALYAAIPPVNPSTMRVSGCDTACNARSMGGQGRDAEVYTGLSPALAATGSIARMLQGRPDRRIRAHGPRILDCTQAKGATISSYAAPQGDFR
jgi:hypothetical protein